VTAINTMQAPSLASLNLCEKVFSSSLYFVTRFFLLFRGDVWLIGKNIACANRFLTEAESLIRDLAARNVRAYLTRPAHFLVLSQ